jgi:hypothetical protein
VTMVVSLIPPPPGLSSSLTVFSCAYGGATWMGSPCPAHRAQGFFCVLM